MSDESDSTSDRAIRGRWPVLDTLLGAETPRTEAEKTARKAEYEAFNRKLNEARIGKYAYFLNYGYVPNENPTFGVVEPQGLDANSRRLVLEVLGDCPLEGRDVLDVSCGRGALASVLKQDFEPRSYHGVDLSPAAIGFCRAQHGSDVYRFEEGDAEHLSLADRSVDVVVNIEASHNYPHVDAFLGEVGRVLRPGGAFLYADFLRPDMFAHNRRVLEASGFVTERDLDITGNVLLSSDQMGTMRLSTYEDPEVRAYMENFLAVPGSEMYGALEAGILEYRLYRFRGRG